MNRWKIRSLIAGSAACMGLALAPPALHARDVAAAVQAEEQAGAKFLRYVEEPDHPRLQTSIIRYENGKGAHVDLIGAVHVGDQAYFDALNRTFKNYDVVLYEMVKPRGMDPGKRREANAGGRTTQMNFIHTLQRTMQESLDLKFQLDEIDYSAKNFVHADLDAETFTDMQQKRGESMMSLMLEAMLKELMNPREPAADAPGIMDLIDALQSPNRARALKMVVARQFNDMDRSMSAMEGSVIIEERNHQALKVLKEQIDAGKTDLAIYYGAGHFATMEKQLVDLMGFKQVGEPRWLTAWDLSQGGPAALVEPRADGEAEVEPATRPAAAGATR